MKSHKIEIMALTLLLGVLGYAFYDTNIKGSEQKIVLSNELLSMREINDKEDITMEMLEIPAESLLKDQKEKKEIVEEKQEIMAKGITNTITNNETADNSSVPYNEIISNQIINFASQFVGNPYVYGGNSLTEGTDCSGFTKLVFANYGIYLPRSAPEQAYSGVSVKLEDIMPGDIVVSGYDGVVCHSSLYIGNNELVHALNSSVGIVVTSLYIMPIIDVRRVA